ncbi:MAG: class I SAM-dependent methyltransferase [Verrucomicrobia bacterium]|nr:class I SAM-dependent methyltransferase [Verrucomicrobiota bacterium]
MIRRIVQFQQALGRAFLYFRYRSRSGYDAARFWEQRHQRFQSDFRAVASVPEEEHTRYPKQKQQFLDFLAAQQIGAAGSVCIEFGCGNGFWGQVVLASGAKRYTGMDISATAVAHCQKSVPGGSFRCCDLGSPGEFADIQADMAISIDVTQHIVSEEKLSQFLRNMSTSVCEGGHIIVTSYTGCGNQYTESPNNVILGFFRLPALRWVYAWDVSTIQKHLVGCELVGSASIWDKTILAFRKTGRERK